ncbi:MAG: nitroreductase family protein [Oscillospiraceae bacterium]|nr:nitroreductase family protein [Oscillospiraceae bacterium]
MDFRDISKMRVTVRQFAPRPVEKSKTDLILEAGRWSPTAVDYQPQRILVLNTAEKLEKVRQFCTFGYDPKYVEIDPNCDAGDRKHNIYYYGAPLVFLVCWDKNVCWTHPQNGQSSGATDATIVTTHMMLEAASLGLGTVWISYFDHDKARELLNIPEKYEINGMLYVGYPSGQFKANPKLSGKRYPISHTCFYNDYSVPYQTDFFEDAATVVFHSEEK